MPAIQIPATLVSAFVVIPESSCVIIFRRNDTGYCTTLQTSARHTFRLTQAIQRDPGLKALSAGGVLNIPGVVTVDETDYVGFQADFSRNFPGKETLACVEVHEA
jgi:hypothetical protein